MIPKDTLSVKSVIKLSTLACGTSLLLACASAPVKPTYVSSAIYKDYSCAQLEKEYRRVNTHINTSNTKKPFFDTTGIGVGIHAGRGGVYPTVSVGMGRGASNDNPQLSRLLGERDAIAESAHFKGCDFSMPHTQTQTTKKQAPSE